MKKEKIKEALDLLKSLGFICKIIGWVVFATCMFFLMAGAFFTAETFSSGLVFNGIYISIGLLVCGYVLKGVCGDR